MPSRTSSPPSLSLSPPLQYPLEMPYYEAPLAGQLVAAVRPKRKQVKNACSACQRACKRCDVGRPCERCIKYGMADSCRDSQRKERKKGVKRGPYKKRDEAGSSDGKTRRDVPTVMSQDVQAVPVELHSVPSLRPPDGPFPYSTAVMVTPQPVASHQLYQPRYDLSRYRDQDYRTDREYPSDHSPRDRQYPVYPDRVQDYPDPHDHESPPVRDYAYPQQRSYPDNDQYYYDAYSYPSYNYSHPVSQPMQQQHQSDAAYHHLGRMVPDHYASTPSSINPYSAQPQMSTALQYSPMRTPGKLAHRDSIDPSPSIVPLHHHQHHPQHVGNVQIQSN